MAETIPRRAWQFFFFILAFFLIGGVLIPQAVQAQATVSVDSISNAKVNSTVEIAVHIADPSGMAGFQFDLEYDQQVVLAIDVQAGSLLPAGTLMKNMNNADSGSIRVVWLKGRDSSEVNEDGELCLIFFQVLSSASTELELKNVELVNEEGSFISFNSPQNGRIGFDDEETTTSGNLTISTSSSLPYAYKGSYFNYSFSAGGGTGSYIWEKIYGSLPPGLTLRSSGVIYGTPTSIGRYDFDLRVTNNDDWAEQSFTLWVLDDNSQVPYLYDDYGSYYASSEQVTFENLKISQGSMEINLGPEKMPHTMVVDGSINWINLNITLNSTGDALYINDTRHNSSTIKSIPLSKGTNEVSFYIKSSGKSSSTYFLTIYRMPGRR